jgi:hypothetical protein
MHEISMTKQMLMLKMKRFLKMDKLLEAKRSIVEIALTLTSDSLR